MSGASTALLEQLVKAGRVSSAQKQAVLASVDRDGIRVEDALVEQRVFAEEDLLKFVAALHKTRFVTTEKLSKVNVDRGALKLLGRAFAEQHLVCPVVFSARDKSLSVVAADPGDSELVERVKMTASVTQVKAYAARPAAVRAAIQKHYGGDIHAFAKLDSAGYDAFKDMLDVYERNLLDEDKLTQSSVTDLSSASARGSEPTFVGSDYGFQTSAGSPSMPARDAQGGTDVLELAQVLVSLLENQRAELRGHSSQVARLLSTVAAHMGLPKADTFALSLAGLLHDLGKGGSYHLTPLNVAEYEGHRTQANKAFLGPVRLMASADLPPLCIDALTHMYERLDGQGFPDRRSGKDIPLGARLLAIADTYADLTSNERNPFRKKLSPKAALEVLTRYKDKVFDGNLVDLFRVAALGSEGHVEQGGKGKPRVLLVDSDAEETTVLELRLVERGCEVVMCRTANDAVARFKEGQVDAMIVEVELRGHDGFALVEHIRKLPAGADLPVLFLSARSDRSSVDRGFALGCVDYVIKPATPDVVVAKTKNALARSVRQRGTRGVSGALSEMPLPDVLQVLARTRKTGRLKIAAAGYVGEIHFKDGDVYNAMFMNHRGEDAVFELLQLSDGTFALDPSFVPDVREIDASVESLLLEGMRRWDEARNDFGQTRVE